MGKFRTGNQIDLRQIFQREEVFVAPEQSEVEQGTEKEPFENKEQQKEQGLGQRTNQYQIVEKDDPGQKKDLYQIVEKDENNPSASIRFQRSQEQDLSDLSSALDANDEAIDTDFKLVSALGTPLVMPVMIEGYQLPNEPIITITGSKKIVKTALTGVNRESEVQRRGTVKELISVNDYAIKITGRIIDEDDPERYPDRIVTKIRNLFELRRALSINCKVTDLLGITHIAVDKLSFPGDSGMENSQRYEISGFSDEDFRTDLISQEVS